MGLLGRKRGIDEVVDLRDGAAPKLVWGSPAPCPECGGPGYLDHIDLFREVMYLHCVDCTARYEISKAQIDAMA